MFYMLKKNIYIYIYIYPGYVSKHDSNLGKQVVLLRIPNLVVKDYQHY